MTTKETNLLESISTAKEMATVVVKHGQSTRRVYMDMEDITIVTEGN